MFGNIYREKKILITGNTGFKGAWLTNWLLNLGAKVIGFSNEIPTKPSMFKILSLPSKIKYITGDICDYTLLNKVISEEKPDFIFHLAAQSRIQPAVKNPIKTVRVNCEGTTNVLQASRVHKVKRVIYSSTSACYGLKNEPPLHENMNTDCLNPYSVTKVGGEEICKMYTKLFGLQTVIFRYFNVYGDRQPTKGQYAPVIGLFKKQKDKKCFYSRFCQTKFIIKFT